MSEYRTTVINKLSIKEDSPILQQAEVVCFPAFHQETLLSVTQYPEETTIRLGTFSESYWYATYPGKKTKDEPRLPLLMSEVKICGAEQAKTFWEDLSLLNPITIQNDERMGLDGMGVEANYQSEGSAHHFQSWSPPADSPIGQYLQLIIELAVQTLRTEFSLIRLENLFHYASFELPVFVLEGAVKRLRFFDWLDVKYEQALQTQLDLMSRSDKLIMDMSRLKGIDQELTSCLTDFSHKQEQLAWVATGRVKKQLEEMNLENSMLFDSIQDAEDWLAES